MKNNVKTKRVKALSLFANVGIAESYLKEIGIDVVLANEIDEKRIKFYQHLYPETEVIPGDITSERVKKLIITKSKKLGVDLIMATPPCQGMSTAGKMDPSDERNNLVCHAIEIIKEIKPKFVFLENVPEQLSTYIIHDGAKILIPDYVFQALSDLYQFNDNFIVNAQDYGVPQNRERAIMLMVRKDINVRWNFPSKEKLVTLRDAIGKLPPLDPEVKDITHKELLKLFPKFEERKKAALKISKWHYPPQHIYRQVISMMHTPTGKSAFDNIPLFQPHKKDGTLVKGFKNTYKRQLWDKPGFTITMFNRTIGSQNNVHPGRFIGKDANGYDVYSDPRVLTIYELMILSSLPLDWDIPKWATDNFIRSVIGEGIPPLLVKKIMMALLREYNA